MLVNYLIEEFQGYDGDGEFPTFRDTGGRISQGKGSIPMTREQYAQIANAQPGIGCRLYAR